MSKIIVIRRNRPLSGIQFRLLGLISNGPVSSDDFSTLLINSKIRPRVSVDRFIRVIKIADRNGFVNAIYDPNDFRKVRYELNERGKKAMDAVRKLYLYE